MSWERVLAHTTATQGPQGHALHLDVGQDASEVGRVRNVVRTKLVSYAQAELDVITLLLSELLTNALLHGGGKAGVDISVHQRPSAGAAILVGVSDASSKLPQQRPPRTNSTASLQEHGLGLQIVGQLADDWGTVPLEPDAGKIVWFLLNVRVPESTSGSTLRSQLSGTRPPA
jgi:anti-sigma regulatory factor (Ser/Thr protein kinase)